MMSYDPMRPITDEQIMLELAVIQEELPDLLERLPHVTNAIREGQIWGASYTHDFYGFLFACKDEDRAVQLATKVAVRLGFDRTQATNIEVLLVNEHPGQMPANNKALEQMQRVLEVYIQQHTVPEQP